MLDIVIALFVFCIMLFFYLHIQFHLKISDDLEIYEIEQASKDKMEEICDLRQPVLFDSEEESMKISSSINCQILLETYPTFEVKIRDNRMTEQEILQTELYIPLSLRLANKLFSEDKTLCYFSENNNDFLNETGAVKNMSYNDEFLRPHLVSNCNYDIMMASNGCQTPLRYEINYRNYFLVTEGSIRIKLFPPKCSRYLYPYNDYENFEFRSPINPWDPQTKYRADFDKIKSLEITLTPGRFLFIPSYWWYSFQFAENTCVCCFNYRTYMNNIAIAPHIFMYALQNQNVQRKIVKKLDISEINKTTDKSKDLSDELTNNQFNNQINEMPNTIMPNEMSTSISTSIVEDNIQTNLNNISSDL
jgi:hypothetical protein